MSHKLSTKPIHVKSALHMCLAILLLSHHCNAQVIGPSDEDLRLHLAKISRQSKEWIGAVEAATGIPMKESALSGIAAYKKNIQETIQDIVHSAAVLLQKDSLSEEILLISRLDLMESEMMTLEGELPRGHIDSQENLIKLAQAGLFLSTAVDDPIRELEHTVFVHARTRADMLEARACPGPAKR